MSKEEKHIHVWKMEMLLKDERLYYTGNMVCECGEIIWKDEVETLINMSKNHHPLNKFGLRGR